MALHTFARVNLESRLAACTMDSLGDSALHLQDSAIQEHEERLKQVQRAVAELVRKQDILVHASLDKVGLDPSSPAADKRGVHMVFLCPFAHTKPFLAHVERG